MKTAGPLSFVEFIALLALLLSTVAYSIDAMLPLLEPMGAELSPEAPERAQMVMTVFLLGLGLGTFVAGPLSDALGRKRVILGAIALYMIGSAVAVVSGSMSVLLVARFVQGLGASGPRVVTQAMVRDLYSGRIMARVLSLSMTLFALVPAVAPLIGAQLGAWFGWRAIFWSFIAFGAISALWLATRQPETLPPGSRRRLEPRRLWAALSEVLGHARVRLYLAAMTLVYAILFVWLAEVALVFSESFERAEQFPAWFALVALLSAPGSLINAKLVVRWGMRRLIVQSLTIQALMSVLMLTTLGTDLGAAGFWVFLAFMIMQYLAIGFQFGNLNALALEPMGHVAGMAASVMGSVSTVVAALIATPVALVHDGTPLPITVAVLVCTLLALGCMALAHRLP